MAFTNKIRLPFYVSKPQYPADEEVYVKANGKRLVLNSTISKELEGKTEWMPQEWHERFTVALRHDQVNITSQNFTGLFRLSGSYEIEWLDFLNYPTAPAKFKGFQDGFSARSNLCNVCEAGLNLELKDDFINVEEGGDYNTNAAANDIIACDNPVFEIAYINSDYVREDVTSIDQAGMVVFSMKTPLASISQVLLITYKVTCGSESMTANIVGGVTGTLEPICPMPENVTVETDEEAPMAVVMTAFWDPPPTAPDGYSWNLERISDGAQIGNGNTTDTFVTVNALGFNTGYRLRVYSTCGSEQSIPVVTDFTTPNDPAGDIPHTTQAVLLSQVNDVSGLRIQVNLANGIAVEDDVFISGTITSFAPTYSARMFNVTLPAGDIEVFTNAIFGVNETTNAVISNVSIYPTSSKAVNQNLIIDFQLSY